MCTVTFVPVERGLILTSSRDEKIQRGVASPPSVYSFAGIELLFPKDADAGGTWIAIKDHQNAAVLLNGAFTNHKPEPPYKESRGLILLRILSGDDPVRYFRDIDLSLIEPFTLVLIQDMHLFECRWNGRKKYCRELDKARRQIWSSATLYDEAAQEQRRSWFQDWSEQMFYPSVKDIFCFHRFSGAAEQENAICMKRGLIGTVSITSIFLSTEAAVMDHFDIGENKAYNKCWKI